ncbi:hypothetical protein [Brevibacillus centrosporus]|uniref:hypothetical protein n=1 Tax=Brevibacillus centrosporus TaxID=54910 RepID=UPI002E23448A|nr:hypothetical protein [Brevibacillus centrosporus]
MFKKFSMFCMSLVLLLSLAAGSVFAAEKPQLSEEEEQQMLTNFKTLGVTEEKAKELIEKFKNGEGPRKSRSDPRSIKGKC